MTRCWATVASYLSLPPALSDWDAVAHGDQAGTLDLVDAALVEGDPATVSVVHRHRLPGLARGAAATALVGLLRPPAIITGALAGGVGERVLGALCQGIARSERAVLGRTLDAHPFSFVAITEAPVRPSWVALLDRSVSIAVVESSVPAAQLARAVEVDGADGVEKVEDDPADRLPATLSWRDR